MLIVAGLLAAARPGGAFICADADGNGCPLPGTTCYVACDEADVRSAIDKLNGCPAYAEGDEVTIAMGPDAATPCGATPIPLAMAPTAPATATGSCGDDNAKKKPDKPAEDAGKEVTP